jgi:hypothetical protein
MPDVEQMSWPLWLGLSGWWSYFDHVSLVTMVALD